MIIGAASSAAAGSSVITVTVGTDTTNYGYVPGPFGSRSPTVLYGQSIFGLYSQSGITIVELVGVVTASFFNRVSFYYGASGATLQSLVAASATFTNPGGTNSRWQWANTTFSATDNGLSRLVIFYR